MFSKTEVKHLTTNSYPFEAAEVFLIRRRKTVLPCRRCGWRGGLDRLAAGCKNGAQQKRSKYEFRFKFNLIIFVRKKLHSRE